MSNGLDVFWVQSSPSVHSIWTGLDQNFDRIFGLGLDGLICSWAGRTGLLFEATSMDWIGLDLILWMGLDFRCTQERQKCVQNVQIALLRTKFLAFRSFTSVLSILSVTWRKKLRFCGTNNDNVRFLSSGWTLVWIGLGWTNFFRKFHGPGLDGLDSLSLNFQWTWMDWEIFWLGRIGWAFEKPKGPHL